MRSPAWIVLALGLVACSPSDEGNSAPESVAERSLLKAKHGPLAIELVMLGGEPRLGDRVSLVLRAASDRPITLEPYRVPPRAGHLRVRGRAELTLSGDKGECRFEAEPERSGPNVGQLPPLRFRVAEAAADAALQTLSVPGFEFEVAGPPPGTEVSLESIAARPDLVELGVRGQSRSLLWILGVAAALGMVGTLIWLRRKPVDPPPPPPIDPRTEARLALDRLLLEGHIEARRFDPFYVGLTGIVRHYVERTTNLSAPDLTTEEFLREAAGRNLYPPAEQAQFARFLESADLVKYAGQIPETKDIEAALARARTFCGLDGPIRAEAA